ncbi:MAG: hypothetical protein ABR549_17125 [Mycobacteriales bacterium]
MTPFQELRFWLRRAPAGERTAAAVAVSLVVAVLVWVLVPATASTPNTLATDPGETSTTGATTGALPTAPATGPAPGASVAAPGSSGGKAGTSGATSTTGGATTGTTSGSTTTSTGGGRRTCPAGAATGVSDRRIKIAVLLVSLAGPVGNSLFGVASPADQQKFYEAAIAELNGKGGAGCRQLQAQFFEGNPADQSSLRQLCLDVADAGVFAVLDAGAYAQYPLVECYAQHKLPYFGSYLLSASQQRQYYPYLFDFNVMDNVYHDAVFGLKGRGFFTSAKGFTKLGFIYRSCDGPLIAKFKTWLGQAGVSSSQLVTYDVGCPSALASPSDLQQAVLKFKGAGVTNVTTAAFLGDFANFTKYAQQQGFRPRYGLADDSVIALSYGTQRPDPDNLNGAIAIAPNRDGEERTPGSVPTAGTARCDAALKKQGLAPTYASPAGAGNACNNVWMFAASVDHATLLRGDYLAAGLQASKSVDFSYPEGPSDFARPRLTTGGQFWRATQFHRSCSCWQLLERPFHPTFS